MSKFRSMIVVRFNIVILVCIHLSLFSCKGASESIFTEPIILEGQDSIVFDVRKIMDVGTHLKSKYTQSMSVYGDTAFVFYTDGYCKIFDLKNKRKLKDAVLASLSSKNHVNSSMFSNIFYSDEDRFPLLYVSPYGKQICYVERYHEDDNTFELIQTITVSTSQYNKEYGEFVVDEDKGLLYCMTFPSTEANNSHIKIFNLPRLNNQQITLTDEDLLATKAINLYNPNVLQGAFYQKGYIYMIFGYPSTKKEFYRISTDDFSYSSYEFFENNSGIEPEGITIYNDSFVICTNSPAAIWNLFTIIKHNIRN